MPANLPPEYFEVEKSLRGARTPQEKIEIYEKLIAVIPKHKGTEKLIALYRSKIAKAKEEVERRPGAVRHTPVFKIEKQGAGQVALAGPPNAGKSLLVRSLTGVEVEVADYPFTTRRPSPFMMPFENVRVQLVDTPPVTRDFMESWFPELVKAADAVMLVADLGDGAAAENVAVVTARLAEKKVELAAGGTDIPAERFPFVKRTLLAANKVDRPAGRQALEELKLLLEAPFEVVPVSALSTEGLEDLRRKLFELLSVIRAYSKPPGKKADQSSPFILKAGSTVMDMARAVHKDFAEKLAYARVWNASGLEGLRVNREYVLSDGDTVELHI